MSSVPYPCVRLGDLLVDSRYGTSAPSTADGTVPVVGIPHIRGGRVLAKGMQSVSLSDAETEHLRLRLGDILITRTNSPELVGRAGIVDHPTDAVFASYLVRLRVDTTRIDPRYLNYWLNSTAGQHQVRRLVTRAVCQANVNPTELRKHVLVPVPPLPEQQRIASILATWDSAIEKNERLRRSKEIQYRAMVDRVASDVTTGSVRVASVATERSVRNRGDENGPVMSVTNRSGFEAPGERFSKRIASEDVSNYKVVRCGDYAYNPSRLNVGSIGRLDGLDSAILSPMYVVFSLDAGSIDSDYFLHWLRSSWARGHIRRSTQGSVRDSVGFSDFGAIRMALPSRPDQERMSAALNTARAEIALLDDLSVAYRRQKTAVALKLMPSGGQ